MNYRLSVFLFILSLKVWCQSPTYDYAVPLQAVYNDSNDVTLLEFPTKNGVSHFVIFRKNPSDPTFGLAKDTLPGSSTFYIDSTTQSGNSYEYKIEKHFTSDPQKIGFGYIQTGIEIPAIETRGHALLLIDSLSASQLTPALDQLVYDYRMDGWITHVEIISNSYNPPQLKQIIAQHFSGVQGEKVVFLVGDIPVPYSGQIYPDGHTNHEGAWPADPYYADLNGIWTDATVTNTQSIDPRNHNLPGDGKFDQSTFVDLELQIGRVTLTNLSGFADGPIELTRKYLEKNHRYKRNTVQVIKRSIVDDNFTNFPEGFAAVAYKSFSTLHGIDSVFNGDYMTNLRNKSYQWSFGCGGGSWNFCSGVLNYNQLITDSLQSIFTMLFGSYFGDWDRPSSIMRACLANGSTLTNCWAGRPHWYFHHMALGKHIGYSMIQSLNNVDQYYSGYCNQWVHSALHGDPSLRLDYISPPSNLILDTIENTVQIQWTASTDSVMGYWVYKRQLSSDSFERITPQIITDTFFTDPCLSTQAKEYMIRALALSKNASGTYYNLSLGIADTIQSCDTIQTILLNTHLIDFSLNHNNNNIKLNWVVQNETSITKYTIEKSYDSISFFPIGQQHNNDQQNVNVTYSYIDNEIRNGDVYYRIRINNAHSQIYSSVLHTFVSKQNTDVMYPNPCKDKLHLQANNFNNKLSTIYVENQLGQRLDVPISTNSPNTISIHTSALDPGIYYLKIQDQSRTSIEIRTFVKF